MRSQKENAERLIATFDPNPGLQHELTFYASFAQKSFTLMQREGPEKEGFGRLQQSFRDAVDKVRTILGEAKRFGFPAEEFLELSPAGMANLIDLIGELARIKQSTLH